MCIRDRAETGELTVIPSLSESEISGNEDSSSSVTTVSQLDKLKCYDSELVRKSVTCTFMSISVQFYVSIVWAYLGTC